MHTRYGVSTTVFDVGWTLFLTFLQLLVRRAFRAAHVRHHGPGLRHFAVAGFRHGRRFIGMFSRWCRRRAVATRQRRSGRGPRRCNVAGLAQLI